MNQPSSSIRSSDSTRTRRIYLWLIFVGLVALASSLVTVLIGYVGGNTPTLMTLLAEGDGFLVAVAITADAIGRAVEKRQAHTIPALSCALVLVAALTAFGVTKTRMLKHRENLEYAVGGLGHLSPADGLSTLIGVLSDPPYKEDRVEHLSLYLMAAGLFTSFMIIVKEEG